MKWNKKVKCNSNQILTFLEIYKEHDCFWDTSSPSYLKRDVKNMAFENIHKKLIADFSSERHIFFKVKKPVVIPLFVQNSVKPPNTLVVATASQTLLANSN